MYESPYRKKTSPAVYIALIASWIIILGGIWWLFFRNDTTSVPLENEVQYFMGEQVLLKGTLTPADDITQFSHVLTDADGNQFGLRSLEIPLNGYAGIVEVKGEVVGFRQQTPIVQVADVIGSEANINTSGATAGAYRYIKSAGLGIDLSAFPGYTVSEAGNLVTLSNQNNEEVLTINHFVCDSSSPDTNCAVLKNSVQAGEQLTNAAGIVFNTMPETEKWYAFNGTKQGYVFAAASGSSLQTHLSAFSFVDSTLFDKSLDQIKLACKDINSRLAKVTAHEVLISEDGSVIIGLDGSTVNNVAATCKVRTSLTDPTTFALESYMGASTPEDTTLPSEDTAPTAQPDTTPTTTPKPTTTSGGTTTGTIGSTLPVPEQYATWKPYPSIRGWTMFVQRNVISYKGMFGTGEAGCPYRLELSHRSNNNGTGGTTGAAADSLVYECTSAGASALLSNGYTKIGYTTGSVFVRKDMTSALQGIGIYIQ